MTWYIFRLMKHQSELITSEQHFFK